MVNLAGLVAITAPCVYVNEIQSIIIGAIGGIVMLLTDFLLEKSKIDDAVGAIQVHLGADIWGTLSVGIFGNLERLNTDLDRIGQIVIQILEISSAFFMGFPCFICAFTVFK